MKTNFIRQISHEIRTPLNILNGFTQVITSSDAEGLDAQEKADIQHRITENTNRITELVNKILELSDVNSQAIIQRTDDITALQIATEAVNDSCIYNATHIQFSLKDNASGKVLLHTNRQFAVRALGMLLDNAQKFTKEGEVRLYFKRQPSLVEFIVEDTGIGIPVDKAEDIFDEFVQLDDYYDGMGIGLTVARSIIRRLGGDITLDTTYTDGSRFIMTLPL
jgi:K+-sensing histidine kinase KdpD